ncbi:hypothetical protein [Paenibacillus sp. FSL R7-0128]|uniref:hypothetical protein n=1 Tax=Paenibacillus sp. FSL R7-0128 TaxID=2954529 RepID=UPI0030F953BC
MVVESFVEKRKRELREKNGGGTESASSFIERRKKELRGEVKTPEQQQKSSVTNQVLKDTLSGVMKPSQQPAAQKEPYAVDFKAAQAQKTQPSAFQDKLPAANLIQTGQGIQSTLKDKVPAANLVQQTGRGPANASDIPGISQYEINKKEIADDNVPDAVKAYANIMNYITQGNPAGVAVSRAFAGNSGATRRDTTKFPVIDKVTDAINDFVTPFITPTGAPVGSGPNMAPYEAANKVLNTGIGQKYVNYAANSLINRGLIPKGSSEIAGRVAAGTVGETLAGPLQNVAAGLINGQDSNQEVINNAQIGLGAGLGLGYAGSIVSEGFTTALGKVMKKAGRSDSEVAETLEAVNTPQAEVVRQNEIKTNLPETNPLALPQSPELLALPPGRSTATTARIEQRTNVYRQKFENLIAEAQKRSFSPGREDIELENLWSQMADRTDPSLNELIDLAYPKRTTVPQKGMVGSARANQEMREVAGVGNPVKSSAPQVFADAAAPTQVLGRKGTAGTVSEGKLRTNTLTREQEILNKVNTKQTLTQEDIDFAMSKDFDQSKLFPEATPEKSSYVKPLKSAVEPIKTKVEPAPEVKAKVKVEPAAKKTIVTEVKKVSKLSSAPEKKTPGIRANYKTIEQSGNISSGLKAKVENSNNKVYTIFKDEEANRLANNNVRNLEMAESRFMANKYEGKEGIATGYRVSQELDKLANATNDPDLKEALFGRALAALDKVTSDLTKAGQTSQAGSLIKRMSPEGQLQNLIRKAKANKMEVIVADSVEFKQEASKYLDADGAGLRENELSDAFNRLEKGAATKEDMIKIEEMMDVAREKAGLKKKSPVKDKLPKELKDTRKRDKVVSFLEAQEAAAQARINKRRGRLNSLPVDEWIDYSILIAAKVGKGIIKAETYAEDLVKLFGEDIRPIARQVFEKAQELVGSVTKGSIEGDFIKADNAFKRITGKSSMNQQERIVEKYVAANPQVTPGDIESLRKLSKSLTELQGTDKIKADMAMQKILNNYEKSTPWNKVQALRYISMLLNDATQSINAISGPLMASYHATVNVLHTMIDIGMHATLKTPRNATLYGTNPLRFIAEYYKHAKIGGKAGAIGVNPAGIQNVHEIRGLAFKSLKNPLTVIPSLLERSLGAVAKGADYATYGAVYQAELRKAAYLDAINNGIKRSDKKAIENYVRKFINDPPIEAVERADLRGKSTTFQRSDSLGGKTANWLNAAPKPVKPVVTAIVPFVRTPLNIASTAVTASPGGIVKGLIQLSSASKASQYEAIRSLSMGITGVGMSALGFYLARIGIITGANDTGNKDVNSINEQAGRAKYRFNTSATKRYMTALLDGEGAEAAEKAAKYQKGDKQFDYNKLQPLAFPLAMGAGYQDAKGNVLNKTLGASKESYNSLFGMTSLKGVQDTFQPQYTGSQGDKSANVVVRIVESYIKSFSPSALAQEARRQDPIQRKTTYNEGIKSDISTYYKSRIPGLSKTLPPSKDTLGNTKRYSEGFAGQHLNPYKSEVANYSTAAEFIADLIVRTGDQSIAPAAPFKSVTQDGETINIPQKRYEKLQEDMGGEITKRIIEIEGGTDQEMIEQIKEIYEEVREEFREEVKDELFD